MNVGGRGSQNDSFWKRSRRYRARTHVRSAKQNLNVFGFDEFTEKCTLMTPENRLGANERRRINGTFSSRIHGDGPETSNVLSFATIINVILLLRRVTVGNISRPISFCPSRRLSFHALPLPRRSSKFSPSLRHTLHHQAPTQAADSARFVRFV